VEAFLIGAAGLERPALLAVEVISVEYLDVVPGSAGVVVVVLYHQLALLSEVGVEYWGAFQMGFHLDLYPDDLFPLEVVD